MLWKINGKFDKAEILNITKGLKYHLGSIVLNYFIKTV